jgi:hypothetical protein
VNPDNPVIRLCALGMEAEGEGRPEDARQLFLQAWSQSSDDFEACVAAHYVARHQLTPEAGLRWNEESLARAEAVSDGRVDGFYPSLYLNLGKSHEQLGHVVAAQRFYALAAEASDVLGDDGYGRLVRRGIAAGQNRLRQHRAR